MKYKASCLLALAVAIISVAMSDVATASERSERLYSRGLVRFHARHFSKALQLFERAVKADPKDPQALYYRGVTRGRLGDFTGAATDLRAVLAKKPDLQQATLELGAVLVEAGRYRPAIPWLQQAQRVSRLEARASQFLGIAQLRLGRSDAARRNFERAAKRDPALRVPARYYLGVIAFERGEWVQAEEHFSYVASANPNSALGREAAQFLVKLRQEKRPNVELYGAVGFAYDSNVVLAPSDDVVKDELSITKQQDGRATFTLGGRYVPWRAEQAELSVGYEFYQSLHFELTGFDLQGHRPSAQVAMRTGRVQIALLAQYDYYLLDNDSFLQAATGFPWMSIAEGDGGRTELFYRMRYRDFRQRRFSKTRDAFNHAPGIRQVVYLGSQERYVSVGYRFDREDPLNAAGDVFAYDGHEADAGIGWAFPAGVNVEAAYAFRDEQFDAPSNGREDSEHLVTVSVSKRISSYLTLTVAYFGSFNDSNKREFDYDRQIVSLALEVEFY
ncbi:MAG: tetratricopeptide repeat protein [Candidatus Binatia bacterium]